MRESARVFLARNPARYRPRRFVDGIVLHQILQWHHMLSSNADHPVDSVLGLQANTLWDALFHALEWVAVLAGLAVLHHRLTARPRAGGHRGRSRLDPRGLGHLRSRRGIVDHHILALHQVRQGTNEVLWDIVSLGFGAFLVLGGWLLQRSAPDQVRCSE